MEGFTMRTVVLLAILAVAAGAWAQEPKKEPARQEEARQEEAKPRPAPVAKKSSPKRHQDARHCLEKDSNTEIIKCAEAYL
ncbi:MAG TPA: hypothetical protein VHG88_01890 [Burkholderiales bacterium]|nr:hypothetical protein [Burkholderiales bacterium]